MFGLVSLVRSYFITSAPDPVCTQEAEVAKSQPLPAPLLVKWGTRHVMIRRQFDYSVRRSTCSPPSLSCNTQASSLLSL